MSVHVGSFNVGTGAGGTTQDINIGVDLTAVPFVAFFTCAGRTESTDTQGEKEIQACFGAATSTSSRWCVAVQADHGATTQQADNVNLTDCCIASLTTTGGIDGKCDFAAALSTGFRLIIDDQFATDLRISFLVIAHADLQVHLGSLSIPTSTGTQDITAPGFAMNTGVDDKAVLFATGDGFAAIGTPDTWMMYHLGVAAGDTITNVCQCVRTEGDAGLNTVSDSWGIDGHCFCISFGGTAMAATVSAWLSTGFRLNWSHTTGAASHDVLYCAMQGIDFSLATSATRTDTSAFAISGEAFRPAGAIFGSHSGAVNDVVTGGGVMEMQAHGWWSLGFVDSDLNQAAHGFFDRDAHTDMDCGVAVEHDAVYVRNSSADPSALEGVMAVTGINSDGLGLVMADADPSAMWFWTLLIGGSSAVAIPTPAGQIGMAGLPVGLSFLFAPNDALLVIRRA